MVTTGDGADGGHGVDLRGTLRVVRGVPGLLALIAFSCFNNFIGGAFMAVMDPYGLSLVSVQAWGLLWGLLSAGVIIGGLLITRTGVGANPVRTLLLVNLVLWTVCIVFPLRSSIVLLVITLLPFMLVMPYAEAAEQTILQRVVPFERQGRVFGFAQSVEQAASPLTAFLIAPHHAVRRDPVHDRRRGRPADRRRGSAPARTAAWRWCSSPRASSGWSSRCLALASRPYRRLSAAYAELEPVT